MSYDLFYDQEENLIKYISKGKKSYLEIKDILIQISNLIVETQCYTIFKDLRASQAPAEISELIDIAKLINDIPNIANCRIALLHNGTAGFRESLDFYEGLCKTAGYNVRTFSVENDAKKWLISSLDQNSSKSFNIPL